MIRIFEMSINLSTISIYKINNSICKAMLKSPYTIHQTNIYAVTPLELL